MYNSYARLPNIPYRIMEYLANSPDANDLWKMLKYNDYYALDKPSLSFSEKMELVWRTGPQEKFGVFLTPLVEDAISESKCIMKLYDYYIHPKELYSGVVVFGCDFLYGGQMALVEKDGIPVNRADLFVHTVLKVLNGVEVEGIGKLSFLDDLSRYSLARSAVGNSKTFAVEQLYLATLVGDTGVETGCGD